MVTLPVRFGGATLLHWKSLAITATVLLLGSGLTVACSPRDETATPVPGPDYTEYSRKVDQASALFDAGEYHAALEGYQQALAIIAQIPDVDSFSVANAHDDVAKVLSKIAEQQDNPRSTYEKALEHYHKALVIRNGIWGAEDLRIAPSLDRLGGVYLNLESFDLARSYYQKALDIRKMVLPPDHAAVVASHENLAVVHLKLGDQHRAKGDYAGAASNYRLVLEHRKNVPSAQGLAGAAILDKLAEADSMLGAFASALTSSREALTIREEFLPPDHVDLVTTRNGLALLYGKKADVHYNLGEYAVAEYNFDQAQEILQDSPRPDPRLLAAALNNLAVLHDHLGHYRQSQLYFQDALDVLIEALGPDDPDTIPPRQHLADAFFKFGDYQKAMPLLQKVVEISQGQDPVARAISLNDLGAAYLRTGQYDQALPRLQESLEIARTAYGPDSLNIVPFVNNLAALRQNIGDDDAALGLYREALKIRRDHLAAKDPAVATSLNNLGALYFKQGSYQQALPLFLESLQLRKDVLGPDHPDTAISLNNLGVLHASQGNYEQALDLFVETLDSQDRTLHSLFAVASEEQKLLFVNAGQSTYLNALSQIYRQLSDRPEAIRQGMELVLGRKGVVLDSQSHAQEVLLNNLGDPELQASWGRLQRLRSDLAHLLLSTPDPVGYSEYQRQIEEIKRDIDREENLLSRALVGSAPQPFQGKVSANMVAANLPENGVLVEFVHFQEWDEQSKKWAEAGRYVAFVLTWNNQLSLIDLGDAGELDSHIDETRKLIEGQPAGDDWRPYLKRTDDALADLYQRLIQPLELPLDRLDQLIFSPEGQVNKVPFAALRTPEGRYLVETHTVAYVSTGRDLLPMDYVREPEVDLVLAADLEYDAQIREDAPSNATRETGEGPRSPWWDLPDFPELPGTAEELKIIPPLVPGNEPNLIRGADGTESALLSVRGPRILHLATHGFFQEDKSLTPTDPTSIVSIVGLTQARGVGGVKQILPRSMEQNLEAGGLSSMVRSGLALSGANQSSQDSLGNDGILTALEVTGMDLRGTHLVVLSACQTAEGDAKNGEGVFGLRRAFALAGASNLLMSQWRINDELTVQQMASFYQKAFGSDEASTRSSSSNPAAGPANLGQALRQAQLNSIGELREISQNEPGGPFAPVRLWAPFIIQVSGPQP